MICLWDKEKRNVLHILIGEYNEESVVAGPYQSRGQGGFLRSLSFLGKGLCVSRLKVAAEMRV